MNNQGHDDAWIAHQDDFTAALAQLNQVHKDGSDDDTKDDKEEEATAKSLEKVSKSLKKRVQ